MDVQVNYLAVFLAAVSTMVVGSVWYGNIGFGKLWMKLSGVTPKKQMSTSDKLMFLWTFLLALLTAYILAHVSFLANQYFGNSFFQDTVSTAFWVCLGFSAARLLTHNMFDQRPPKLSLLAIGNEFATILVMGVIIGWMGL